MGVTRTAEAQRDYRRRKAAGLVESRPPRQAPREVVPLTDDERAELESKWEVEYRRVIAAWLIRQRSPHTRQAYTRAWQAWLRWCRDRDVNPVEPESGAAGVWMSELASMGYAPATRAQWRVAVRQALIELTVEGLRMGGDPFARVPAIRVPDVSTSIPLSDEDVHRVIAAATELGGQHRTAVLLLAVMGLRSFEAGQVVKEKVRPSPWGMVADIVGKGQKNALVPVPAVVLEAAAIDGWPMDGRKGNGRERIRYLVECAAKKAGVQVSPHQFRHWHATAALREGVPLERVQDSLRHSDPATTQRYNRARGLVENHSAFVIANLPAVTGPVTEGVCDE